MELFRKLDKSLQDIETILQQYKNKLEPFIKVFSLQSHSEYLELIRRIKVYDLLAYTLVSQKEPDNLYMLFNGRMKIDLSDHEDLDEFAPKTKYIKKKKNVIQDDVPEGYLIDRQNMTQIFAIENCTLLMLTSSDITWLVLKHEQMKRQKRTFFMNTFKPISQEEKQFFCQISDSLELYYYKEQMNIMKVYEKLDHLFLIFSGRVQIYTKRNIIMECTQSEFLNEECGISNYSAIVLSEDAQILKIDQQLLQKFPESAKKIIEKSKKHKGQIRRQLVENHIVDLQIPEKQTFKLQRHHKFRSMISLDKLFSPIKSQQLNTQLTVSSALFKREQLNNQKNTAGNLESPNKEIVQILFEKKQFTSTRTLQSQTSDKQNRTSQNFQKLLNINIQPIQLSKSSKKVQSLCLLPDMSIFQQRKTSQY